MICFAILAHADAGIAASQIRNIRRYNADAEIVLYNGGTDPDFGSTLGVPVCPYSRPLQYGRLERFLLDTALWLETERVGYDYLVGVDSDVLFVREGFEQALRGAMSDADAMGVNMTMQRSPFELPHWIPGKMLWEEWDRWQPFFGTEGFCGTFNPMQVYTRDTIRRVLADLTPARRSALEGLLASSRVFALEELLLPTLALRAGARIRSYPETMAAFVRCGEDMTWEELQRALRTPEAYFLHPARRDAADPVWRSLAPHCP